MTNFSVVKGNIVNMKVDAIVNAANTSLLGGEGVDGAIHSAAGTELLSCCRRIGGCKTGDAVITPGFKLDAKYIIHTVGPVWNNGLTNEAELLRQCYIKSLDLRYHIGKIKAPEEVSDYQLCVYNLHPYLRKETFRIQSLCIPRRLPLHIQGSCFQNRYLPLFPPEYFPFQGKP